MLSVSCPPIIHSLWCTHVGGLFKNLLTHFFLVQVKTLAFILCTRTIRVMWSGQSFKVKMSSTLSNFARVLQKEL